MYRALCLLILIHALSGWTQDSEEQDDFYYQTPPVLPKSKKWPLNNQQCKKSSQLKKMDTYEHLVKKHIKIENDENCSPNKKPSKRKKRKSSKKHKNREDKITEFPHKPFRPRYSLQWECNNHLLFPHKIVPPTDQK